MESKHQQLVDELRALARKVVGEVGLELVELHVRGSSRRRTVRVDIDRPGTPGVGIEDCKSVDRALGEAIEASELLDANYVLEVSSPGIDRPIRSDDDIRRNTGRAVVVTTTEPIEGRSRFRGLLLGSEAGWLRLRTDETAPDETRIPIDSIQNAHQDAGI